ncbi:urotensin-2B [Microtus ochrogaster]|uniref:Urotensin-2B n=1 Tax=Microtus ochrogaster TaxID=79684 RepID=A0ABM0KER3_MICOH|nr:urotensin-2B [Microtus ochrogaster]
MKVFSTSLCFGLLALLSVMNLLKSAHGRQPLIAGHELFPANEHTIQEKLLLALLSHHPGFQRPSHTGVDLPISPEDLKQLVFGNTVSESSLDIQKERAPRKMNILLLQVRLCFRP